MSDRARTDYYLLEEFRLSRSLARRWSAVSTLGFFALAYAIGAAHAWLSGGSFEPIVLSPDDAVLDVAALLTAFAVVVVVHEGIHGAVMARYGTDPSFGVDVASFALPFAYAGSDGESYARDEMLAVLLAPLAVVSVAGVALSPFVPSDLLVVALAANAAGSVGDCWMAAALLRYPSSVRVAGLPDPDAAGMGIYGDLEYRREDPRKRPLATAFAVGALWTFGVVLAALVAVVIGALAFGTGDVVVGDPDGVWFFVRHELEADGSAVLEFGALQVSTLCAAGGLVRAAVARYRDGAANAGGRSG